MRTHNARTCARITDPHLRTYADMHAHPPLLYNAVNAHEYVHTQHTFTHPCPRAHTQVRTYAHLQTRTDIAWRISEMPINAHADTYKATYVYKETYGQIGSWMLARIMLLRRLNALLDLQVDYTFSQLAIAD